MRGETIVEQMGIRAKQYEVIDFCICLGKNPQEMDMLMRDLYKEECFAKRTLQYWHKSFSNGHQETSMLPKSGRPKSSIRE